MKLATQRLRANFLIWQIFWGLWVFPAPSFAELRLELDKTTVELGKQLKLEIVFEGTQAPPSADLHAWSDDWFIDQGEPRIEALADGRVKVIEPVKLYPRKQGELALESIATGGQVARPQRVQVTPAIRNGIDGTPQWQAFPSTVWQGEALRLQVDVPLLHPSNHVAIEDLVLNDFAIEAAAPERIQDQQQTLVRLSWQLVPLSAGLHTIELPRIEQRGRGRWRHYLPSREIEVRPLPLYLPANLLVGEPSIEMRSEAEHWQIRLQGNAVTDPEPYGVRQAIARAAGQTLTAVDGHYDERNKAWQYQVPVQAMVLGDFTLRPISLSYFDTEQGTLRTANFALTTLWRMPGLIAASLLFGLLATAAWSFWLLYPFVTAWQRRRQCLQALSQAKSAQAIRECLQNEAAGRRLLRTESKDPALRQALEDLEAACFSQGDTDDLAALKTRWHKLIAQQTIRAFRSTQR